MALVKNEKESNENWDVYDTDKNDPEELKNLILGNVGKEDANIALNGDMKEIVGIIDELPTEEESQLPDEIIPKRTGIARKNEVTAFDDPETNERTYLGSDGKFRIEPKRSKMAFERYLMMGRDRSLAKLAATLINEKPEGWENVHSLNSLKQTLSEYSTNFEWQDRIRLHVIEQSGKAVAKAQKEAASSKHERIRRSRKLQQIAEQIFDRAEILGDGMSEMTPEEARQLIKPATQMMQIGLAAERAEIGESLAAIAPPKPVDTMTEEELDAWIATLRENL